MAVASFKAKIMPNKMDGRNSIIASEDAAAKRRVWDLPDSCGKWSRATVSGVDMVIEITPNTRNT